MAKHKFDSAPAPAGVTAEVKKGNVSVEEGAGIEVATGNHNDITVEKLFDKMKQELQEKRKLAKKEGRSEAEIKTIKFDKNSDTYKAWILAFNENQLDLLTKKEDELQAQIEAVAASGKEVSEDLFEKWRVVSLKIAEVSNAKRARNELSRQNIDSTTEIQRLSDQEKLVGVQPAMEAKIIDLQGMSHVADVQIGALDDLTVGIGDSDVLEEYAGKIQPLGNHESFFLKQDEQAEVSGGNSGTERIRSFFSKELEKEAKKRIKGPKDSFTKKDGFVASLNDYVGDDAVFATLLLKDANFVKSVQNYFNTEVGIVGKAAETAALQFVHTLKSAREKYDELVVNMKIQETMRVEEEKPPEIPENLLNISVIEVKIEQLKKKSAETNFFFGGSERKEIAKQIKELEKELAGIAENLAKTATELLQTAGANSDIETLKAVAEEAADLNKNVISGNIKPGSSKFNKYARIIMAAMAGLTFASSVGEVGGKANKAKPHVGGEIKPGGIKLGGERSSFGGMSGMSEMRSDFQEQNGMTEAVVTSEMPSASPFDGGSSEPAPEVAGGFTSAGDLLTPASDIAVPAPGTYTLRGKGGRGHGGVKIASVDVGGGGVKAEKSDAAPLTASSEAIPMEKKKSFDNAGYDNLDFSREWNGDLGKAHRIVEEIQKLAPVANDKQKAVFKKDSAGAIVLCKMFLGEDGHADTERDEAEITLKTAQKQHDALDKNLPKEKDVESLASRVKGAVDQLASRFASLTGSNREGAEVVGDNGALERIQMVVKNILATKQINERDRDSLRGVRVNLDRLLLGESLTRGERAAASELIKATDILLQGVPKSDTLWKAPLVGDLTGAQVRALRGGIDKKAGM